MIKETNSLKIYLKDIKKNNNLDKETILKLIIQYKNGNIFLKDIIIKSQLKLVLSIASKFQKQWDIEDLISEGNIALIKALDTFDCKNNASFTTYASVKIKYAIVEFLEFNKDLIYISDYNKKKYNDNIELLKEENGEGESIWNNLSLEDKKIDVNSLNIDIKRILSKDELLLLEDMYGLNNKPEMIAISLQSKYNLTEPVYSNKRWLLMKKIRDNKNLFFKYL